MNIKFLLSHTLEVYGMLERANRPADAVLSAYLRARKYLGSHDRRFISETIFGLLRQELTLKPLAKTALSEGGFSFGAIPVVSLYFFLLKSKPFSQKHLIDALEELTPFDAAELKSLAEFFESHTSFTDDHSAATLSQRFAFPEWMTQMLLSEYGQEELEKLYTALNEPAAVTLRTNTLQITRDELQQRLGDEGLLTTPGTLSPDALICKGRPRVMQTQSFKEGLCEIQDEGSQLISILLNAKPKAKVLDACAGGGGKTLHIATLMHNKGDVYAYDANEKRFGNITIRIRRSGLQNIRLLDSPKKLEKFKQDFAGKIDALLIDAPCTGSGTVRRNPDLKRRLTQESLERIQQEQQGIINEYAPLLKPGGTMVYATCSLFKQENEDIVTKFLSEHPDFKLVPIPEALEQMKVGFDLSGLKARFKDSPYMKLSPQRDNTDGFFAAVLTRKA
ncbi:MAG: class I SAM-dependent methyltransferase [Chlorobiales bacterium]|nr:class I SAM-dependent methyltransferase [Chlorobiales bacterium]